MKAAVVAEENTIEIKEIPVPVPAEGQVLIKVETAAQNPGDCEYRVQTLISPCVTIRNHILTPDREAARSWI
jgi:NADPH:quinone reductase-like Zn-dependent oxidoreductase